MCAVLNHSASSSPARSACGTPTAIAAPLEQLGAPALKLRSSTLVSGIFVMAEPQEKTFFYYETCPCAVQCSASVWKNAKVWGWTPEEAKARLVRHLMVLVVCLPGGVGQG